MSITDFTTPFYLSNYEQALAKSTLETIVHSDDIRREPDGSLPDSVKNFVDMLRALADGRPISVIPRQTELTLSQAANFLCVSEDYLTGLLDSQKIESVFEHGCRRVAVDSLLEYDKEATRQQNVAFDEVVRLSEEMGLYDD